jgi:hypothetical protein
VPYFKILFLFFYWQISTGALIVSGVSGLVLCKNYNIPDAVAAAP